MKNLSKRYGHLWALRSLNVTIEEGESVAVLGPNGAGKSTLLGILATHVSPSEGSVRIMGRDAFEDGGRTRRRTGFVGHDRFLYDELTVEENLAYYAGFFRAGEADFSEVLAALNLGKWRAVPVKQLSYGLRKRADIARALVHDPDLILLDELFSGLDEESSNSLVDYFKILRYKTLVISSHSVAWARRLCERSLVLERGNLVRDAAF